jgi:hypothetical protein
VNVIRGAVTCQPVAQSLGETYQPLWDVLDG